MVRYFGCGKNRVNVEPPVDKGVTESCMQTDDPEVKSFMSPGDDRRGCWSPWSDAAGRDETKHTPREVYDVPAKWHQHQELPIATGLQGEIAAGVCF